MAFDRSVEGRRVRLISTTDSYTSLKPGALGTASFIDDMGTLAVQWDDGSRLGMVPRADQWEFIS